jgi:hypothetical protein
MLNEMAVVNVNLLAALGRMTKSLKIVVGRIRTRNLQNRKLSCPLLCNIPILGVVHGDLRASLTQSVGGVFANDVSYSI